MGAFIDGWQMLQLHSREVLVVTACILGGGSIMLWLVPEDGGLDDRLSLAASSWALPGLLLLALVLLTRRWLGAQSLASWFAFTAVLLALAVTRKTGRSPRSMEPPGFARAGLLVALTFMFACLRLAFVRDLQLPQYFDSATHYGLVRQAQLWSERAASWRGLVLPVAQYYHLGYHVLMAGMATTANLAIAGLMLVSGQLILALMPLAAYAPAHRLSGSGTAALMAVVLVAAGWYMPAFATNWGKYPALFGMLMAWGVFALALMAMDSANAGPGRRRLWMLAALMTIAAGLVHTRTVVIILAGAGAVVLSGRLWKLPVLERRIFAGFSVLVLLVLVGAMSRVPELSAVFEPYSGSGMWITLAVLLLTVCAFKHRPREALATCLFLAFLLVGLIVPSPWAGIGSILDRPLVEFWIFAPLSMLGGVGFAGLTSRWGRTAGQATAAVLALVIGVHALVSYDLKASSCCTIVMPDDLVALNWLGRNLKSQDRVGIATEQLQLSPSPYPALEAPVDAGAWVTPLTGLEVVPLPRDRDVGEPAVIDELCRAGVRYIYVGGSGRGFDIAALLQQPRRFAPRLMLPGASVFEMVDCVRY